MGMILCMLLPLLTDFLYFHFKCSILVSVGGLWIFLFLFYYKYGASTNVVVISIVIFAKQKYDVLSLPKFKYERYSRQVGVEKNGFNYFSSNIQSISSYIKQLY